MLKTVGFINTANMQAWGYTIMEINLDLLNKIRSSLHDDISKKIFDARIRYAIYRDDIDFSKTIASIQKYETKKILLFGKYLENYPNAKGVVIYGAGHDGELVYELLRNSDLSLELFYYDSDKEKKGKFTEDISWISWKDILNRKSELIMVISSKLYCLEIYNHLVLSGFPCHQVFIPAEETLKSYFGIQYFDFFQPNGEHEVFIDGGCFDGLTAIAFHEWCGGKYDAIYSFDANPNQYQIIESRTSNAGLHDFELIKKGMWSSRKELRFSDDHMAASSVNPNGNIQTIVDSIDNVMGDKRVTFIKMDIEGSEYEALLGAKKTIKTNNPRLAISIYHKPEDVFEIPLLIREMNNAYKFAIRHYTSYLNETVLYAWVD